MSQLLDKEIETIVETYKRLCSIEKTAKETGYSVVTVGKYVKHLSSKDKRSKDCKNAVLQIDMNTGEVIKEWDRPAIASKKLGINAGSITRALKGELKQAGGYRWKYKEGKSLLPRIVLEKFTLYRWTCVECGNTNIVEKKQEEVKCSKCGKWFTTQ